MPCEWQESDVGRQKMYLRAIKLATNLETESLPKLTDEMLLRESQIAEREKEQKALEKAAKSGKRVSDTQPEAQKLAIPFRTLK